jgi:hypothetical protein
MLPRSRREVDESNEMATQTGSRFHALKQCAVDTAPQRLRAIHPYVFFRTQT